MVKFTGYCQKRRTLGLIVYFKSFHGIYEVLTSAMVDIVNSHKAPNSYFCLFVEKLLNPSRKPIHATNNGNTSPLKNYTV